MRKNDECRSFGLAWYSAPVLFFAGLLALLATWACMEPVALRHFFDQDGYSPFELATVPFYAAIVPFVWWKCPFSGSRRRRTLLCLAVTCVATMAVVKELDLHLMAMKVLFPDFVNADGKVYGLVRANGKALSGTPFKMPVLTHAGVPLSAKAIIVLYFASFFGVFGVTLGYFAKSFVQGVFKLQPVAWSVGCFGASGVMVQMCDRIPAWYRHVAGMPKPKEGAVDAVGALFTAFEEGGEMMIACFALWAIWQSHHLMKCGNPNK